MSGPYQHYPHQPQYYGIDNGPPGIPPEGYSHDLHHFQSLSSEHLNQAYAEYDDGSRSILPAQASSRARRRPVAGGEHVKHRRTRSGCYTCRNRRVKCDETHPICERCQKGNRECIYPEATSTSKGSRSGSAKSKSSPQDSGSCSEDVEFEGKEPLPSIPDDEDYPDSAIPPHVGAPSASHSRREASDTPSLTNDKSPSPSTEGSTSMTTPHFRPKAPSRTSSRQSLKKAATTSRSWSDLPHNLRFYLEYHRTEMSYHHYCMKVDGADFMRTTFLEIAVKHEPLLYAVVGFAAYFHTLTKPNGRIQDFLGYYNKSVSLLRASIQRNSRHNVGTLLTILQLATIEELLGDWVNLMGHQKAAYEIITSLYTPQTIMQNDTLRKILQWYMRFDLFVGFQAGNGTVLGREWPEACYKFYAQQAQDKPHDITCKYEERFACSRLFATDTAMTFAKKSKGLMTDEEFTAECSSLVQRLAEYNQSIDLAMTDPAYAQKGLTDIPPRDPDDIVDPYDPDIVLYSGDHWATNLINMDYWAINIMFQYSLALAQRKPLPPEVVVMAYKLLQTFEAIELCPTKPPGAMIETQASLGMATLFLPKDQKHIMWCRKKFAKVESCGYIYPATMRTKFTEAWGVDVTHWWLPNDEMCPPIIRAVKDFIEERTTQPKDQTSEDLRIMKGIFSSLSLNDSAEDAEGKGKGNGLEDVGQDALGLGMADEAMIYEGSPDFGWNYDQESFPGEP